LIEESNNTFQLPLLFDSSGKLALDQLAAFPNLLGLNSGRVSEDEIDSLNLRRLFGGICRWLQAQ
jgi:hypothetical protein